MGAQDADYRKIGVGDASHKRRPPALACPDTARPAIMKS
jgi:hypothetical protein